MSPVVAVQLQSKMLHEMFESHYSRTAPVAIQGYNCRSVLQAAFFVLNMLQQSKQKHAFVEASVIMCPPHPPHTPNILRLEI